MIRNMIKVLGLFPPVGDRSVPLVFSVNSISTWKSILRASRTLGAQKYVQLYVLYITLIPRLPHCPVFDHLQCMQTEGGGLVHCTFYHMNDVNVYLEG